MQLTVSTGKAAKILDIPEATLEKRPSWGPPYIKAGRRVLYRIEDLKLWLEDRARQVAD